MSMHPLYIVRFHVDYEGFDLGGVYEYLDHAIMRAKVGIEQKKDGEFYFDYVDIIEVIANEAIEKCGRVVPAWKA